MPRHSARRPPHAPRKRLTEPLDTKRLSFGAASILSLVISWAAQIRLFCHAEVCCALPVDIRAAHFRILRQRRTSLRPRPSRRAPRIQAYAWRSPGYLGADPVTVSASTSRPVQRLRVHRPPAKPPVAGVQVSESQGAGRCGPVRRRSQRASIAAVTSPAAASRRAVPMSSRTSSRAAGIAPASASPLPTGKNGSARPCTTSVGSVSSPRR